MKQLGITQNFLRNPRLVEQLLDKTTINVADIVYDIGAGMGSITLPLSKRCHKVIAIELDPKLTATLREHLPPEANIEVRQADFLNLSLPMSPYKVFANIPFNISADIVRKLTSATVPPAVAYLIVQKQFADKLLAKPTGPNSQLSILLASRFETRVLHRLHRSDFTPRPQVDTVLLEITPRLKRLLPTARLSLYEDFVAYVFNAFQPSVGVALKPLCIPRDFERLADTLRMPIDAKPSQLAPQQWVDLFQVLQRQNSTKLEKLVKGHRQILAQKHTKHTKLHRTRQ